MIVCKQFAIAQACHPRAVGRLMYLATSTIPKLTRHKHGGTDCGVGVVEIPEKDIEGTLREDSQLTPHEYATPASSVTVNAASLPVTLPPPAPKPSHDPRRTDGILATNYAAQIPGTRQNHPERIRQRFRSLDLETLHRALSIVGLHINQS